MSLFTKFSKTTEELTPVIDDKLLNTEDVTEEITNEESIEDSIDDKKESTIPSMIDVNFGGEVTTEHIEQADVKGEPENFFFDMGGVTLLNNTTIYFNCFVEKNTVDDALRLMKRVNHNIATIELEYPEIKGKIPFKFVINSGGGNVVQGLRLFDAIKDNPYPVNTVANGMAASMGIIILTAGEKVQATRHSVLMIHQLSAGASGKYFELKDHMKFWTQLQEKLGALLTENTKAKKEDINKFMAGETYILAEDALKLGLLDEIVSL